MWQQLYFDSPDYPGLYKTYPPQQLCSSPSCSGQFSTLMLPIVTQLDQPTSSSASSSTGSTRSPVSSTSSSMQDLFTYHTFTSPPFLVFFTACSPSFTGCWAEREGWVVILLILTLRKQRVIASILSTTSQIGMAILYKDLLCWVLESSFSCQCSRHAGGCFIN